MSRIFSSFYEVRITKQQTGINPGLHFFLINQDMTRILCTVMILLQVIFLNSQTIQEKVIGGPFDDACYGGLRLGNSIFFAKQPSLNYLEPALSSDYIYQFNLELGVKDSISVAKVLGISHPIGTNRLQRHSDSTMAAIIGDTSEYHIVILDTTLNLLQSYDLEFGRDTIIRSFECISFHKDKILVGGAIGLDPTKPWLNFPVMTVLEETTGLRSKILAFDSLLSLDVSAIYPLFDKILLGFGGRFNPYSLMVLDSNYTVDSLVSNTVILPFGNQRSNYLMAHNGLNGNLITLGFESFMNGFSMIEYNPKLEPIRRDTFPMDGMVFLGNDNFEAGADSSFFMAATIDPVNFGHQLKPGLNRKLEIWKIGHAGNLIWKKEIVDSSYRLVTQLISEPDGGIFVISTLYDPATYATNNTDLSIIKLDANGNIQNLGAAEHFFLKNHSFSLYPNPAREKVRISRVEDNLDMEYAIYGISGHRLAQGMLAEDRQLDVSFLQPGPYLIQLKDENGVAAMRKLIVR